MLNAKLVTHAFDIVERDITDGLREGYVLKSGTQYEDKEANELFKALLRLKKELSLTNLDALATHVLNCESQHKKGFIYQEIRIAIDTIRIELEKKSPLPKRKP